MQRDGDSEKRKRRVAIGALEDANYERLEKKLSRATGKRRRNRLAGSIISRTVLTALLVLLPAALVSGYFVLDKEFRQSLQAPIDSVRKAFSSTFSIVSKKYRPDYSQQKAAVILSRGNALRAKGRFAEAEHAYQASLEKFELKKDNRGMGNAHVERGILHTHIKYYRSAKEDFQKALGYFTWAESADGQGYAALNMAQLHFVQKHFRSAEKFFLTGKQHYETSGNQTGQANAALGLANLYTATKQVSIASRYFGQAENLFKQAGNNRGLVNTYNSLGRVFCSLGTRQGDEESRRFYQLAKSIELNTDSSTLPEFIIRNSFAWLASAFDQHRNIYQAELNTKARYETEKALQ